MSIKDYYIIVNCSLTRVIILIVIKKNLGLFAILIIVILTQRNIRARRGFREDLKEQYKFYLNLRVYSPCRV